MKRSPLLSRRAFGGGLIEGGKVRKAKGGRVRASGGGEATQQTLSRRRRRCGKEESREMSAALFKVTALRLCRSIESILPRVRDTSATG